VSFFPLRPAMPLNKLPPGLTFMTKTLFNESQIEPQPEHINCYPQQK